MTSLSAGCLALAFLLGALPVLAAPAKGDRKAVKARKAYDYGESKYKTRWTLAEEGKSYRFDAKGNPIPPASPKKPSKKKKKGRKAPPSQEAQKESAPQEEKPREAEPSPEAR